MTSQAVLQDGHETDYVLPQQDVTEDLSDFVSALEKLEAVVQDIPAPALDDQQARRLSHATRAPAAAMLAAIWSPRLAEPLQSISPSLASVAHAEMLNGLTMAATNGFPSMVCYSSYIFPTKGCLCCVLSILLSDLMCDSLFYSSSFKALAQPFSFCHSVCIEDYTEEPEWRMGCIKPVQLS